MTELIEERNGQAERRDATRIRLLETATELFSLNGYHGTQVMDIVTRARVSAGTFYRYFEDKSAIFFEIAQQLSDHEFEEWAKVSKLMEFTTDFRAVVRNSVAYYESHYRRIMEHAALYRALYNSGIVDRNRDHQRNMRDRSAQTLAALLERMGLVETSDYISLARMIMGVQNEIRYSMIYTGSPTPEHAARMSARFLQGAVGAFSINHPVKMTQTSDEWAAILEQEAPVK